MSNVAIAAAVTAYARIHMIPFKIDPNTLYTDTDSSFTSKPIDPSLIGDQLGQMKDELNGKTIEEALFLGIKKYGYWYLDDNDNKTISSVFAGVRRNSLSFDEIIELYKDYKLHKHNDNRFYHSFNNLNISIKSVNIFIQKSDSKLLVDNNYIPLHIINGRLNKPFNVGGRQFNYLISKIFKFHCFYKYLYFELIKLINPY